MLLAVFTTFAASRKEPLADVIGRVHDGFLAAGFGQPSVRFTLADAPGSAEGSLAAVLTGVKRVSSVQRVLKRWPELERFAHGTSPAAGSRASSRVIANVTESGAVEPVDFAILREIAQGVPKSFPFHVITLHFSAPGFSDAPELPTSPDRPTLSALMRAGVDVGAGDPTSPGVNLKDAWWVNGRQRYVAAMRVIEADPEAKKLPPLPAPIAVVFGACGKVRKTLQVPLVVGAAPQPYNVVGATPQPQNIDTAPEIAQALRAVVHDYRTRMSEVVERARLPHDLLLNEQSAAAAPPGFTAGPKKPELVRAFTPLGYDCRGESGSFTLRRRTPGNLTVEVRLDVGTWSSFVMAMFRVLGLVNGIGFKATLILPVTRQATVGSQYPIGGPEGWRRIVDNLAALVVELDRSFVPAIEAISGPAPDWYRPENFTGEPIE